MTKPNKTRRDFLKQTGTMAAATGAVAYFPWNEKAFGNQDKNDRPTIGCIGVGFMIFALALRFYPRRGTAEHFLEGVLRIILYLSVFLLGRGQNEPTEEKIGDLASHVRTRLCGNLFV